MHKRAHPEQGFRTCLGVLKLLGKLDVQRVEAISAYALEIGALNYPSIASIAENRIERKPAHDADRTPILHVNIRGPGYYS